MSLEKGAIIAVKDCMNVKKGEMVVVVTDTTMEKIGNALFKAAVDMKSDAVLVKMLPRSRHGEEPPKTVAEIMKVADVVLAPTKYSLTHTQARKQATSKGARVATLPDITEEMMSSGGMTADFKKIEKRIKRIHKIVKNAKVAKLTTKLGTDLTLSLEGRKWIIDDTGICHKKGQYTNLPAGEIFIAPVEGSAKGKVVVDGSFLETPLKHPVSVFIKEGYAYRFEGGEAAKRVKAVLVDAARSTKDKRGPYNVAELGIGMNDKAKIIGNVLEDEKSLGTVHIGFGDNSTYGGKIRAGIHLDGIIKEATLEIDEKVILKDGKLVI